MVEALAILEDGSVEGATEFEDEVALEVAAPAAAVCLVDSGVFTDFTGARAEVSMVQTT